MKKVILALLFLLIISGVASAQYHMAALISVFGNRNLSGNPLETKLYEAIMKDSSFNLEPIVDQFDVLIRDKFLPQFPFPFLSKEEVVNTNGYQRLEELTTYTRRDIMLTTAADYIPVAAFGIGNDKEAIQKAFEILPPEVDVVMIAYVDFQLYDDMGVGGLTKKKVQAYANVKLFDRKLERVFKLKEGAKSDKGLIGINGLVAETEKIMPLVESASNNLFEDMKEKLPKSLKKMARKLEK